MDEIFAKIEGISVEEYRANASERERISRLAEKYIDSDSSHWPKVHFNRDLSVDGQRFSLDGTKEKEFSDWYPNGFLLGFVNLTEFDKKLCRYSRRDEGELWEVGFKDKLANLIIYLSEGKPISPLWSNQQKITKLFLVEGIIDMQWPKKLKRKVFRYILRENALNRLIKY